MAVARIDERPTEQRPVLAVGPAGHLLRLAPVLRAVAVGLSLIALWQVLILVFQPPSFMFPDPERVFAALRDRQDLWRVHAPTTLVETLIGLATGTLCGAVIALAMSLQPLTRRILLPTIVITQAFPVFAIAPLLVLWFGYGIGSKVVMATIAIFFPVASAFYDGMNRADPQVLDLTRLYGASHWHQVMLVRVPGAMPGLISGIRLAAVYAPIGALVGEWVGASSGLGYAMLQANGRAQTDVVFACLFIIALMSVVLRAVVDVLTARLAPWAPESVV